MAARDMDKYNNIFPLDEHLDLGPNTLEIMLTGLCDAEEKALWDEVWASKRDAEALIPKLMSKLKKNRGDKKILEKLGAANNRRLDANVTLHMKWQRDAEELFSCP